MCHLSENPMWVNGFKTQIRKAKATEWMLELRTAYPYGLNCKIGDDYISFKENIIGNQFSMLKRSSS